MSDDTEKIKNFVLFKMWKTDKEMKEVGCFPFIVLLLTAIGLLLFLKFK